MTKLGLLERLKEGVIIGDGGFVFELEKRGYVTAGPWTPEASLKHPDAVRQLHREFCRSGSDVLQTFTFYASEDKLVNRGNEAGKNYTCEEINRAACRIANEVAGDKYLVAGGICQTPSFLESRSKSAVLQVFEKQLHVFVEEKVDFIICEYFEHVEECEYAVEAALKTNLPVCANLCIGVEGDLDGVSCGDCAVRLAKVGAHVIGLNCHFDPFRLLDAMALMKEGLEKEGLLDKVHLMIQPLAFMTEDAGKQGFIDLPEFPFALEPRIMTRWEMQEYGRRAYDLGIRYIGGCCGFQPYHIRAVCAELLEELPENKKVESFEHWIENAEGLNMHTKPWVRRRAGLEYWKKLNPASGRSKCPCHSSPDDWQVSAGHEMLKQDYAP